MTAPQPHDPNPLNAFMAERHEACKQVILRVLAIAHDLREGAFPLPGLPLREMRAIVVLFGFLPDEVMDALHDVELVEGKVFSPSPSHVQLKDRTTEPTNN